MDALFVNGPFLPMFSRESRSPAVTKSGTLYYPAWLAYGCGYVEENGFTAKLIDCIADKMDFNASVAAVVQNAPKLVVIGTSTPSIEDDAKFGKAIKDALPGVTICLVGTHASSTAPETLTNYPWVDLIARREYDATVLEVLQRMKAGQSYADCAGVSTRVDGLIVNNPDRAYIQDLDTIPFAAKVYKNNLTIENYYYGHVKFPMISIFTSRGCNAKCTYCVYPQTMFGKFRSRSPKNIAAEFKWIAENLPQVKEVLIDDDTFTMFSEHAQEVAKEMIKNGNKLPWTCEARATLDYETLALMKKAGCRLIVVGFESVDQTVLNNIKKGIKMTNAEKFVEAASKAGVKIHGCFMAGNPGDTMETLNTTLEWAISKNFDTAQFFPLQVYPGTAAYEEQKGKGLLKQQKYREWVTKDGLHNMTLTKSDAGMTEQEILDFCDNARRRFYLRPSFILRKAMDIVLDPVEFKKNVKGFMNIRKYLFSNVSSTQLRAKEGR
jgi:anaerobic magnesium-protoporphyrin IX monomethyl ester cyclase